MRIAAILFLVTQSLAVVLWWMALWHVPSLRPLFNAPGTPDSALLAFALPDALLLCGAGAIAAWGLAMQRRWAFAVFMLHAGAASYALLYCVMLWWLGGSFLSAAAMSLYAVEGWLLWRLKEQ